ncbi:hypothetical protein PV327_006377 [Microctonus hyperodae]|uniref:Uncharacterized protein n=1 Tax=Microctonus hyperodae TaxID=165561 RepID=A0AA39KIB8_MICHY|nr:hypothetical protein PV327_006377 [Microctonus hyperodae]
MKVAYVDIVVVLGCMLQTLIGCSHGLSNAPNCSTITCGHNERCNKNDDQTLSCICSPIATLNIATQQCVSKYQWVNYKKKLWNDSRLVHHDSLNYFIVVRIKYNKDQVPYEGQINYDATVMPIAELNTNDYKQLQVLLVEPVGHYEWVYSSNGKVEENAIEGGHINDEIVYVCRMNNYGHNYIGVMRPNNGTCYSDYWDQYYSDYFLLTYKI